MSAQAPKTPNPSAPTAASWAYAESFRPESEAAAAARAAAADLGLTEIGQGTASMLLLLARSVNARSAVEIGSGAGVSGLALLEGMDSAGILTSIDAEHENQAAARRIFGQQGIPTRRFRLIAGQALDVLPKLSDGAYDLVFVNGDKLEYVEYVAQALRLLRHGGLLVMNHALWRSLVAEESNEDDETIVIREALAAVTDNDDFTSALTPVSDGLLIAVKG